MGLGCAKTLPTDRRRSRNVRFYLADSTGRRNTLPPNQAHWNGMHTATVWRMSSEHSRNECGV